MKVLRSGRHTQPSQVEKVAEKAGKAAPVMAISAGALVAVPHGHAAAPVKHGTVAEAVTTAKAQAEGAGQALANAKAASAHSISLSAAQPASTTPMAVTTAYVAKHAKTTESAASQAHSAHLAHLAHEAQLASQAHAAHLAHLAHLRARSSHHVSTTTVSAVSHSGSYSCSGLESLWKEAGGSSGEAFMAAEIAMAESGGNPNAISPTDDFGLWQINGSHGSMATLNPLGNARAAISISGNGSNWGAWTTYTSGAYHGKC
jgi:Lysozyme like domain